MAELFVGGAVDPASHERTGHDVRLATDTFTTHGVIVGMTGSGKTGLGVVLVEEVLAAGLPALLIDPKGDLTNLCLMFPRFEPADFLPWVDPAQAKAAGVTTEAFAAEQAATWRDGLAGWGYGPEQVAAVVDRTELTVYTPGSRAGVPLNIVGSLDVPATEDEEVVADEIEGYVSGLLGLVGIDADPLSSREHILLANLVAHSWSAGRALDLPTLVGLVQQPPLRKLGVFELDQFFPKADRTALAMKLNGLLAAPSFAAWGEGPPLDVQAMLYTPDGRPRCAIVTTAHLSDEERQFVTSLLLAKLVTWMRRQSGTTDLRALLYMDEVAGYLPPTANPPTKKPIMTMMKQARAFGIGVVLSTQNPVDVDYKALSNAGTWMIGRLQTERDKQRLLDGMSAASGGVDVGLIGDTISGLAKREFVLRRAGRDEPEVFTTRWAMSYLRGPMTRDQIAALTAQRDPVAAGAVPATHPVDPDAAVEPAAAAECAAAPAASSTTTPVMPNVASGIAVRWVDPAAPWLVAVGADPAGATRAPAVVARVAVRYDEAKADLVHETELEAVLFPLGAHVDVTTAARVDHDDRDLLREPPPGCTYVIADAPIAEKRFWADVQRGLVDHLTRTATLEVPVNRPLKLYGRPGETPERFAQRCEFTAGERADAEVAALRDTYESKVAKLRDQIAAASDSAEVLAEHAEGRRNEELLSTAGSVLGGLLSGRRSRGGLLGTVLGTGGRAASKRTRTETSERRLEAAHGKIARLESQLAELEDDLADDLTAIEGRWSSAAADLSWMTVALERTDVKVSAICLAWLPVT
jgi:hypothetical protein